MDFSKNIKFQNLLLWYKSRGVKLPIFAKTTPTQKILPLEKDHHTKTDVETSVSEIAPDQKPNTKQLKTLFFSAEYMEGNNKDPKAIFLSADTERLDFYSDEESVLFLKMIASIGLNPKEILVVKVQQQPEKQGHVEIKELIGKLKPNVIVPFDRTSLASLSKNPNLDIEWNHFRGKILSYIISPIKIVPTWHPKKLLQMNELKRDSWNDLQLIQKIIN